MKTITLKVGDKLRARFDGAAGILDKDTVVTVTGFQCNGAPYFRMDGHVYKRFLTTLRFLFQTFDKVKKGGR